MEIVGFLLGTFFFILLEGFFAGSEIVLVSVDRGLVLKLYKKTKKEFLKDFHENPEEYITLTMLGYTISIVFASTFYTLAIIKLSDYINFIKGFEVFFSATLVVFTLLLGEILPKSLFQKEAERLIYPSLWILSKLKSITSPLLTLSKLISRSITSLLRDKHQEKLKREDLIKIMESIASKEDHLQIALRILTLRDLFITEEIKPLQEVVMVEENTPSEQVLRIMEESGYRRLPVYRKRIDQIIGYVDFFDLIQNKHAKTIKELIRPIHYFSEFTKMEKVFEVFKESKEHVGAVFDERGNLLGIITWDDLQSYVIGGLGSGSMDEEEEILEVEKDKWIVDGGIEKEKLKRFFNIDLPEGPYTTLGGFLCFYTGEIPERGRVINYNGYTFKVLQRDERRIIKVMVEKNVHEE